MSDHRIAASSMTLPRKVPRPDAVLVGRSNFNASNVFKACRMMAPLICREHGKNSSYTCSRQTSFFYVFLAFARSQGKSSRRPRRDEADSESELSYNISPSTPSRHHVTSGTKIRFISHSGLGWHLVGHLQSRYRDTGTIKQSRLSLRAATSRHVRQNEQDRE